VAKFPFLVTVPSGLNTETAWDSSWGIQTSFSICADQWELRILYEAFINRFPTFISLVRILKNRLERSSEIFWVILNVALGLEIQERTRSSPYCEYQTVYMYTFCIVRSANMLRENLV